MGDVDAFRKDFAEIRVSDNADPELTAIYENLPRSRVRLLHNEPRTLGAGGNRGREAYKISV